MERRGRRESVRERWHEEERGRGGRAESVLRQCRDPLLQEADSKHQIHPHTHTEQLATIASNTRTIAWMR